jgi:hypothetical protein
MKSSLKHIGPAYLLMTKGHLLHFPVALQQNKTKSLSFDLLPLLQFFPLYAMLLPGGSLQQ